MTADQGESPATQAGMSGKPVVVSNTMKQALGPELLAFLACLWDQPDGVAPVAVSVLPHASLMRLISFHIIEPIPTMSDAGFEIVITDRGKEVMRECARDVPTDAQTNQRSAALAELEGERARREREAATQPSHESAPAETSPGLRPLRTALTWFGRENPTVADQLVVGLVVTIVGGVIAAVIVLLITTGDSGSHAASVSNTHGLTGSLSTSSRPARGLPGQIPGGNQNLMFADLTRRAQFANPQQAKPCDLLEYRVLIYNPGPGNLSGVRIAAYINTITPYRKIVPTVIVYTPKGADPQVAFQGTIHLPTEETQAYVPGSTQILDSEGKRVESSATNQLADSITASGRGIPIGTVSLGTTEYVRFRTKLSCRVILPSP